MVKPTAAPQSVSWFKWVTAKTSELFDQSKQYGAMGYMTARYFGWIVITTGILTLLPLVLEIKREAALEQLEQMQIQDALAKGASPHELAQAGMTSAVDPKVLEG